MKLSRFNVWTENDNFLILYNSMTGALAVFNDKKKGSVRVALEQNRLELIPDDFIGYMIEDGYLITDNTDELGIIQDTISERQNLSKEYFLCIPLNMACNFRCVGCFQNHTGKLLSIDTCQRLKKMFDNLSRVAKSIDVDWFGGEPLLSFPLMRLLNNGFAKKCRRRKVKYSFSLTTNGYLLNNDILNYLSGMSVSRVVTTINGPEPIHNQSRPLKDGSPTFRVILGNVISAVLKGIKVVIRVNVSKNNVDSITELYNVLEKHDLKNRVEVNLQPLISSTVNPCDEICLSGRELANKILGIYKQAAFRGWIVFQDMESMKTNGFCIAEYPTRFITDLKGYLYRCGQSLEDKEPIGYIKADGEIILGYVSGLDSFVSKNPLQFSECVNCNILPICMGGCVMKRKKGDIKGSCVYWKYDLPSLLDVLVLNQGNLDASKGGDGNEAHSQRESC